MPLPYSDLEHQMSRSYNLEINGMFSLNDVVGLTQNSEKVYDDIVTMPSSTVDFNFATTASSLPIVNVIIASSCSCDISCIHTGNK